LCSAVEPKIVTLQSYRAFDYAIQIIGMNSRKIRKKKYSVNELSCSLEK
jgi:hypothetical protein